ncbi:E3 ubiquitin-protein ligase SINA-like 10 [Triticum dicoccoides]|uniref:E3 ubiquitin-protein ligase SINA-like 10 n=1 Tax=Triticum dicoccoides TaxID=85692 RepID=UPI00188F997C|nr:E3 ubiquitin-protein ligase SINA-like 10 [Triticum dicoccoides]
MQGAAAAAERRSRASPDKADESSKKARLDLPDGHMKQEAAGGGDGGAIVGAAYIQRVELAVRIDKQVLHCPLCTLPFKPPVFQCKAGHPACSGCVALLPFRQCKACVDGGGFFDPCPTLDTLVSSTRIGCPNVGCQWYVTYHEVTEHQKVCPYAPCRCTEPGCGYVGAPQALAGHLRTVHLVPVRAVQYGKVSKLQLSVSTMRLVLLGDDNCVFLMTVGALGAGVTAVSVVCARARAATRPRFTCKMWVNLETPPVAVANCGKEDMVLVDMHMRSSSSPGTVVAAGEPTFLTVPPMYLVPAAGDGASMEVPLYIRIDKLSPWSDALV